MLKSASFKMAMLGGGAAVALAGPAFAQVAGPDRGGLLDEVIVTASKREESVREVSGSVSAVSGEQLEALGAQGLADYVQRVPGVVFNQFQPGTSHVVIRGVATSAGNVQGQGTTGYYINEVPLTEPGWTIVIPDVDAFDVDRVEVLRGPQGSLFGSASMGGVVNYIANQADASGFDAAAEGTLSQTRNADLGGSAKAMLNVPIIADKLAVRGVFAHRTEPGYLDNIGVGRNGSSDISVTGGRVSVLFTPAEGSRLSWLSLYQKTEADDAPYRNPELGQFKRSTALLEPNETDFQVHSLRVDQDLGPATFTALAAYQKKSQDFLFDYTPWRSAYNADLGLNLTSPLYIESGGESEGKSLEMRVASNGEGPFRWLFGAMYFETDKFLYEQLGAQGAAAQFDASPLFGPGSGAVIAPGGAIFNAFFTDLKSKETALFGEATYAFVPQLELTVGGRLFKTKIDSVSRQQGFSTYPGGPTASPTEDEQDGFSPKVSLTWIPNDDLRVYGLYSEGFRFGTPNTQGLSTYPVPAGSGSDELKNYELGVRSDWLDGRLRVDATAFYIDWQDIQLRLLTPDNFNYAANGGAASIKGLELSTSWRVTDRFDLQSNVTWMEARLDEPLFILWYGTAPKGAQLPGSADWSVSTTAVYRFDAPYEPTLLLSHRYLSEGISDLNSAVPGVAVNEQGDYSLLDLRLSARFGSTTLTVFGDNLTDDRGVTRTVPEANGLSQGLVRPRTFGVTAHWEL
ncbi:TonB-dependent receptor [Phenylobacterium deserti]|nr:TonB-dependent receptor [Phenylobacterium deserti]